MKTKNIVFILLLAVCGTLSIVWVVKYLPLPGLGKGPFKEEAAAVIASIEDQRDGDLVTEITNQEYLKDVLDEKGPIVLKFYSPFCGACKLADQMYPGIADTFKDNVKFYSINVSNQDLMKHAEESGILKDGIQFIPAFIYKHHNDDVHEKTVGLMTPEDMKAYIEKTFKLK